MVLTQSQPIRDRVRQSAVIRESDGLSTLSFFAMGTRCRISLVEPSRGIATAYLDQTLNWVADFEAKYSRFIDSSLVSQINAASGKHPVELDPEADRLFGLAGEMTFMTRGAFDPTALPLIRLWNWKANPPAIPTDAAIKAAREIVGWNKVERKTGSIFLPRPGMCVDLGGIGKEYAVDMAAAMALQHGISNVLVDFGQDIRVHGQPPGRPAWHVGLEDPKAPGSCWGSVGVSNHAVATSGDYLRHFVHEGRRYGHIIDPRTGYPVSNGCLTVSVIAPSCTIAGILSTSAFILGAKEAFQLIHGHYYASGAIVTEQGNFITPRFHEYLVQKN